jgi:hypothetical protein
LCDKPNGRLDLFGVNGTFANAYSNRFWRWSAAICAQSDEHSVCWLFESNIKDCEPRKRKTTKFLMVF